MGGEGRGLRMQPRGSPGPWRVGGAGVVQPWGLGPEALLQQGLGLARRVIRSEVLVLIHLLLNGQQLALQLVPKSRQCVPDVVGQLLGVTGKEKVKTKVTSLNAHRPRHGEGGMPGASVDAVRHRAEEDQARSCRAVVLNLPEAATL